VDERARRAIHVFRNLTFHPPNAAILGENRMFVQLVIGLMTLEWRDISNCALDVLSNIASSVILTDTTVCIVACLLFPDSNPDLLGSLSGNTY